MGGEGGRGAEEREREQVTRVCARWKSGYNVLVTPHHWATGTLSGPAVLMSCGFLFVRQSVFCLHKPTCD